MIISEIETRGINTLSIWEREYEEAKKAFPKDGPDCWQWYADEAVKAAMNGYSSVAT